MSPKTCQRFPTTTVRKFRRSSRERIQSNEESARHSIFIRTQQPRIMAALPVDEFSRRHREEAQLAATRIHRYCPQRVFPGRTGQAVNDNTSLELRSFFAGSGGFAFIVPAHAEAGRLACSMAQCRHGAAKKEAEGFRPHTQRWPTALPCAEHTAIFFAVRMNNMKVSEVVKAWGKILQGKPPSLSIEITKECPLRCPGCYAYDDSHLGGGLTLRSLSDRKGQELIDGVLEVVDRIQPLHLSLVGGDPLVRYREVEALVPLLLARGIHVQVVTSAFRQIHPSWAELDHLNVVVSIDGLEPEHDQRRAPATYARILKNIEGQRITIHCTITGQMMKRDGYLEEFLDFWTPRNEIRKVWFSLFTPQFGDQLPEILTPEERRNAVSAMLKLRKKHPKLDMPEALIHQFLTPPHRPEECVFALTTQVLTADLKTKITPCQFGGKPDCAQCGCIASMGLAAVAAHKLGGVLPVGAIFRQSVQIGQAWSGMKGEPEPPPSPLRILP